MGDYEKLRVWPLAVALARDCHRCAAGFSRELRWGLGDQMRRASVSVVTNIAEGSGRNSDREFARYVSIAIGSLTEVEACLHLTRSLRAAPESRVQKLLEESQSLRRMLARFRTHLNAHGKLRTNSQ